MREFRYLLGLLFVLALLVGSITACGGDDDDDDDSSSGSTACDKIAECGLGGDLGISSMDECESYLDGLGSGQGDCVDAAENCDTVATCLGVSGDDDSDDDTGDDDDDTAPIGSPPELRHGSGKSNWVIMAADPAMPQYWDQWTGSKFDPEWERAGYWCGWFDTDDDLAGGTLSVSLDGADPVIFNLSTNLKKSGKWDDMDVGLEFTGDFAAAGSHQIKMWLTDLAGNDSEVATLNYSVGPTNYGLGTSYENFTLRGFKANPPVIAVDGSTGTFSDYTLGDYAGKVVMIDSFAGWCPPCEDEATQLDGIADAFGSDLQIFSLMNDTDDGTSVGDEDLEGWTLYEYGDYWDEGSLRDEQLQGVILNDDGNGVAGKYYLANYVPNNLLVDKDGIIRFKMNGFYKPYFEQAIEVLQAE